LSLSLSACNNCWLSRSGHPEIRYATGPTKSLVELVPTPCEDGENCFAYCSDYGCYTLDAMIGHTLRASKSFHKGLAEGGKMVAKMKIVPGVRRYSRCFFMVLCILLGYPLKVSRLVLRHQRGGCIVLAVNVQRRVCDWPVATSYARVRTVVRTAGAYANYA
jgi:hypothetical protein